MSTIPLSSSKKRGMMTIDVGDQSSSSTTTTMMVDDDDLIEIPPPPSFSSLKKAAKQKQKQQVMHHEIIDVDTDEDSDDVIMLNGINSAKSNKGKTPTSSKNPGNSAVDAFKTPTSVPGSLPFLVDDHYAELDMYDCYDEEIAMMQAHFDSLDTPPGVEASIPWWPYHTESKAQTAGIRKSNRFQDLKSIQSVQTVSSLPNPGYNYSNIKPASSTSLTPIGVYPKPSGGIYTSGMNPGGISATSHSASPSGKYQSVGNAYDQFVTPLMPDFAAGTPKSLPFVSQLSNAQLSQMPMFNTSASFFGNKGEANLSANSNLSNAKSGNKIPGKVIFPGTPNPLSGILNPLSGTLNPLANSNPFIQYNSYMTVEASLPVDFEFGSKGEANEVDILKKLDLFKTFDVVEDYSDHHYRNAASGLTQLSKSLMKKIQEEWKILEKDLPDTIFVRAYETRMDLLRAVIMGAEGTPYHDGIFFFDVHFPPNYPNTPPHVYYHSGGLRLNPNLYNCGKVCLSLLNTWSGSKNEKWKPGYSTILQVLVSIQGLVLNSQPYFNEPGYASSKGTSNGEMQSELYSENTFLLSLKTMLYSMRRPPKHFEDLVYGHFFKHAHKILEACQAYKNGAQVGTTVGGGGATKANGSSSCSESLTASLPVYVKPLVHAFTKIGVKDCDKYFPSV